MRPAALDLRLRNSHDDTIPYGRLLRAVRWVSRLPGKVGSIAQHPRQRDRHYGGAVPITVLVLACTPMVATVASPTKATAASSQWRTSVSYPAPVEALFGISCASATTCEAVGDDTSAGAGAILGTTNGGTTWTRQPVPSGVGDLKGISCVSATTCEAVGWDTLDAGVILGTIDGGTTWSSQPVPSGVGGLGGISCASATTCEAVGAGSTAGVILGTTNGGTTWSLQPVPFGAYYGISCVSATTCEAVGGNPSGTGAILGTTNGGTTWASQPAPSGVGGLGDISCIFATTCEAVGGGALGPGVIVGTTNGGTTWSSQAVPSRFGKLGGISCASATTCEAVGDDTTDPGVILATADGGTNWSSQPAPSGDYVLSGISCISATTCEAVGESSPGAGVILATTGGGAAWASQPMPSGLADLEGISCASATTCEAVGRRPLGGGLILGTTNGGSTWSSQPVPSGVAAVSGISCASATICEAVGSDTSSGGGAILGTTNGGNTWSSQPVPSGVGPLEGISCLSMTSCEAVGENTPNGGAILGTTNGGTTWSSQAMPPGAGGGGLGGISCVSAGCFAAGAGSGSVGGLILTDVPNIHNSYSPLIPVRICDTRPVDATVAANQCDTGANTTMAAGKTMDISVTGSFGDQSVPTTAVAVVLNVAAVDTTARGGYLTIWPTGERRPTASDLNFGVAASVANLVTVTVGSSGEVSIYNFTGTADVVVDLEGYYAPTASDSGEYVTLSPTRICDTRPAGPGVASNPCDTGGNTTLATGSTLEVPLGPTVPSSATSVSVNVTATDTTTSGGYLTVYPGNASRPVASNLNWRAGETVANDVVVAVDPAAHAISIYNAVGTVDVVVDLSGYFTGPTSPGAGFTPITPVRICDTRPAGTEVAANQCNTGADVTFHAGQTISVSVAGTFGAESVPSDATAVVLNVTATDSTTNGYFTIYPAPQSPDPPTISDLNWSAGRTVANMAIVGVGAGSLIEVYCAHGSANLVIDLAGYFT